MGKSRQRMESFREAPKKRSVFERKAEPMTFMDHVRILAILVLALCGMLAIPFIEIGRSHDRALEDRLTVWKQSCSLSGAEVETLREMEQEFHGEGIIGGLTPGKSDEKLVIHRKELVAVVAESRRANFKESLERSAVW